MLGEAALLAPGLEALPTDDVCVVVVVDKVGLLDPAKPLKFSAEFKISDLTETEELDKARVGAGSPE